MAEEHRSSSYKYSEAEIAAFCEGMKKLSSYLPDGGNGSVSSDQMEEVLILMKKERRPEQVASYKAYWDANFDGRIRVDKFSEGVRNCHNNETLVRSLVDGVDKNHDGFISEDEFEVVLQAMAAHDTRMVDVRTSFLNFVAEADTNRDGKVSLEECTAWVIKKQNSLK